MSEHSFDPRTWLGAGNGSLARPESGASEVGAQPGEPARAGMLGFALSAAILLAGAAAAYAMRSAEPAPVSVALVPAGISLTAFVSG